MPKEILIASIQPDTGTIDLVDAWSTRFDHGGLDKLLISVDPQDTASFDALCREFRVLAGAAFHADVKPADIVPQICRPDERDRYFADYFGYQALTIASAQRIDGQIETWIQTVFTAKEHPLARSGMQNAVFAEADYYFLGNPMLSGRNLNPVRNVVETKTGHYLRLTAIDQSLALASISQAFADLGISIRGVRQPESEGDISEIAFLTHPCETRKIINLREILHGLPACKKLEAEFRLVEAN